MSQVKRPSQLSQFRSPPSKADRDTQQRQAICDPFNETISSHIADSVEHVPLDDEVNDAIQEAMESLELNPPNDLLDAISWQR